MEGHHAILKKYEALVQEWNTLSLICAIAFAATFMGLVFGLIFADMNVIIISMVVMLVFSGFEYKTRRSYVHIKDELEQEMFSMAGVKNPRIRHLVRKGLWW
jgi:hypothetical protein